MNKKKNKQYLETDTQIHQKLLEILNEQKIPTVAEICRRCRINRTTFYQHYTDILELLEVQQKSMNKRFYEDCSNHPKELSLMSFDFYVVFAEHIKKNKKFYRYFFQVNTRFPLSEGYDNLWNHIIKPYFESINIVDEETMKLRFVCYQAGLTITCGKWVENDCNLSCEEVATILTECITL